MLKMNRREFIRGIGYGGTGILLSGLIPGFSEMPKHRYGFTFTRWSDGGFDNRVLDILGLNNIHDVCLHLTFYQDNINSSVLSLEKWDKDNPYVYKGNPNDSYLLDFLGECKERGFSVMLKPGVFVLNDGWRGIIDPLNADMWFKSYEELLMHYVHLTNGFVGSVSVGCELKSLQGYNSRWVDIVSRLRKETSSGLTYSANWDSYDCGFFDKLDFIGIDAYFPIDGDFDNAVKRWRDYGLDLRMLKKRYRKEIVFTEIGYSVHDNDGIDLEKQVAYYNAFDYVFKNNILPVSLAYLWVGCDGISINGCDNDGFGVFNKPVEKHLIRFK